MTDTAVTAPESQAPATQTEYESALLEQVVVLGDLAALEPGQRVIYYREVCASLRLNPLTKPFDYLVLNGKLRLYPNRTATDQLRSIHAIGIDGIEHAEAGDLYIVTVHGHDREGRTDTDVGAVDVANLKGEKRANAIMKAMTKAKRRLTLSLAGLGWMNDDEVGSVGGQVVDVDPETGEIVAEPSIADAAATKRAAITSGPEPIRPEPERAESVLLASPPADTADGGDPPPPPSAPPQVVPDVPDASKPPEGKADTSGRLCGSAPDPDDDPLGLAAGGPCDKVGPCKRGNHRNPSGTWPVKT